MSTLSAIAEKYQNGKGILSDWLGSGAATVPAALAQARANICTGKAGGRPCPSNTRESGLEHLFGEGLKKIVEMKNQAQLRVDGEKSLFGCDVCGCHLRTKIWTPMEHIKKHTPDAELMKHPTYCWLRRENNL
jgi:hypothetical protein